MRRYLGIIGLAVLVVLLAVLFAAIAISDSRYRNSHICPPGAELKHTRYDGWICAIAPIKKEL
jgi:hypothetical protein